MLLMSAGAMLLMLFIGRWLQSEYTTEKMELQKELSEQFMSARTRMTDTLITRNLIMPILNNPNGFDIVGIENEEVRRDSIKILTIDRYDTLQQKQFENPGMPGIAEFEMKIRTDSFDVLSRGVKLFVSKVKANEDENEFYNRYMDPRDTLMMKNFYAENLKKNDLDVRPVWISNKEVKKMPPPPFYYESHFFDYPYGVQIAGFNAFIFRKLAPNIIFAFLLLSIIITAFIFSFRSLRNQIRLAAMKDDLISNISHELKTPVATVKVAIEAMQQMDPVEKKEKLTDYLGMASQEINRLDLLVNKVMNTILMDQGHQLFQKEEIDLKQLAEDTIQSMQVQLKQKNGLLNFYCEDENIVVTGDRFHISGVLYNLIDNSLKYGNAAPEIMIRLRRAGNDTLLECSDNGPGIPEEYTGKIFDKFFRVPAGNEHSVKGYGLGLYYAAQVMKEMDGHIYVKNNQGAGCTFTLRFPSA